MKRYFILFLIGAIGYGTIEILWRGYTHPTMLVAGGVCFCLFYLISQIFKGSHLITKALIAAVSVTVVELCFGVIFNLLLDFKVWDYTSVPLNLFGQICLRFSFMWLFLSLVFLPVADMVGKYIK